jgi:hypothetical protein
VSASSHTSSKTTADQSAPTGPTALKISQKKKKNTKWIGRWAASTSREQKPALRLAASRERSPLRTGGCSRGPTPDIENLLDGKLGCGKVILSHLSEPHTQCTWNRTRLQYHHCSSELPRGAGHLIKLMVLSMRSHREGKRGSGHPLGFTTIVFTTPWVVLVSSLHWIVPGPPLSLTGSRQ